MISYFGLVGLAKIFLCKTLTIKFDGATNLNKIMKARLRPINEVPQVNYIPKTMEGNILSSNLQFNLDFEYGDNFTV